MAQINFGQAYKKIPTRVKDLLKKVGLIFLATADKAGNPNVSPRTAYHILDDETIAICDWFRSKTFWNLQENNKMSIAVVDLDSYEGYQLKGECFLLTDVNKIKEIMRKIFTEGPHKEFNRTMQLLGHGYPPIIVLFKCKGVFSLAPGEQMREILE
ncbi:hypothetical protein HRbin06_00850 [archaeon HR06]|nr:hypothetical protein HRbin06_00850 [archaeon HR06]